MKISYRQGLFETNSSSVHSISIGCCYPYKDMFKDQDITIAVKNYELGPEILNTPEKRASYLLAAKKSCGGAYNQQGKLSLEDLIKERFKRLGAKSVTITGDGVLYSSYKAEEFLRDLENDNILLDDYLFGDSFVFIDNDNSDYLADEVEKVGMDYSKELRELKRSQYRIH